jgi:hypothetical protein
MFKTSRRFRRPLSIHRITSGRVYYCHRQFWVSWWRWVAGYGYTNGGTMNLNLFGWTVGLWTNRKIAAAWKAGEPARRAEREAEVAARAEIKEAERAARMADYKAWKLANLDSRSAARIGNV